jgi:hypothetical protein
MVQRSAQWVSRPANRLPVWDGSSGANAVGKQSPKVGRVLHEQPTEGVAIVCWSFLYRLESRLLPRRDGAAVPKVRVHGDPPERSRRARISSRVKVLLSQ